MYPFKIIVYSLLAVPGFALPGARENMRQTIYANSFGVPGEDASFDYIVVGGGSAGLLIAARLAEDPSSSVAVVEAGSFYELDNGNGSVIPALCTLQDVGTDANITQPQIDWNYVTTPQAGANNRRMHYARGKTLGGSSARNYMTFHRGTIGSYQAWATQVGDESYTFENLLPYFKRSCRLTPPDYGKRFKNGTVDYNPEAFDASGGPLEISWPNYANPIETWGRVGMAGIGVPPADDLNSGNLSGSSFATSTVNPRNSHRSTSQSSFLTQAIDQTGLKIYTHTLGKKVLFNANKTANGVLVDTAGTQYTLSAHKEVILSAGSFQSPQLLMVSGIGPSQILLQHNIPVLSDLQGVGQNMWDQPYFGISYRVNVDTGSRLANDPIYAAQAAVDYLTDQTGPLTSPPDFIGWEKLPEPYRSKLSNSTLTALNAFPADWPETELLVGNGFAGYNRNYTAADPNDGYQYATISSALIKPISTGNVTIASADMSDPPIINPNWLTDPADVEYAIAAFKRIRQVWDAMNGVTIGPEYFPGAQVSTDEEILAYIRAALVTIWHAAATCAMGKAGDPKAVIDSHASVFGVQGLRVVDASSFPFLTPGHPMATIYALAEKISDDILRGR